MRVRYRILESHFDSEAYTDEIHRAGDRARLAGEDAYGAFATAGKIVDDLRWRGTKYDGGAHSEAARAIEGLIDTPKAVETHDGEADLDEVKAMVRRGELKLRDLVDVGRGWQSVQDCGELYDAVSGAEEEAQSDAVRAKVIGFLVAALLIAVAIAMCGR